jgi:hypothetical protein
LRAVGAVFGAATSFYRKEGRALHLKWVKVFPVDGLGLVDEIGKGLRVYLQRLIDGPVVPHSI